MSSLTTNNNLSLSEIVILTNELKNELKKTSLTDETSFLIFASKIMALREQLDSMKIKIPWNFLLKLE